MELLVIILLSFVVTFFLQKFILDFSRKKGIGRRNDLNRNLKGIRSRLGGVGIFMGFLISILIIISFMRTDISKFFTLKDSFRIDIFLFSLFIIFIIGLVDDLIGLNAWQKFPVEIFAASILFFNGFGMKLISIPFAPYKVVLPFVISYLISVLWIVGITNAMNLVDGIDGLAGGVALFSSISFVIISYINHKPQLALLSTSMIGPLIAFLIYNIYPSKIFMGDSGSLVLGFFLAVLSLKASYKASFGITFFVPVIILFLPIFDTALSFLRRISKGRNPFMADNEHIHHRLIRMGNNERRVFFILMLWTLIFSVFGILSALLPKRFRLLFGGIVLVFGIIVIFYLKYLTIGFLKKSRKNGIKNHTEN